MCRKPTIAAGFPPPPPLPLYGGGTGRFDLPIVYNNYSYLYVSEPRSYSSAQRYCKATVPGGRLAYGTSETGGAPLPRWTDYWNIMSQVRLGCMLLCMGLCMGLCMVLP